MLLFDYYLFNSLLYKRRYFVTISSIRLSLYSPNLIAFDISAEYILQKFFHAFCHLPFYDDLHVLSNGYDEHIHVSLFPPTDTLQSTLSRYLSYKRWGIGAHSCFRHSVSDFYFKWLLAVIDFVKKTSKYSADGIFISLFLI